MQKKINPYGAKKNFKKFVGRCVKSQKLEMKTSYKKKSDNLFAYVSGVCAIAIFWGKKKN